MSNQNYEETKLNSLVLNVLNQEQFDNLQEEEKKANELYLIKDVPEDKGIYYIEGNVGGTAGQWTGAHDSIKEYYPGLIIAYKIGTAGSSNGTKLNINNIKEIPVIRNQSSNVTTAYPVSSIVILIYTIDNDGEPYWKTADYDTNSTTVTQYHAKDDDNNNYPLLFKRTAGLSYTNNAVAYTQYNNHIYVNPSLGSITAKSFSGPATSATNDNQGNEITTTYMRQTNPTGYGSFSLNRKLKNENEEIIEIGDNSAAIGDLNIASGETSIAIGKECEATNSTSIAMGNQAKAAGRASASIGHAAESSGAGSVALGRQAKSEKEGSVALGYTAWVKESGDYGVAIGNSIVKGIAAVGIGMSEAINSQSIAIGFNNAAEGESSTVIGYESKANGDYSTAIGSNVIAEKDRSIAIGYNTIANGDDQFVSGKYNISDTESAFIFGNGNQGEPRSNAFTLDWDGNAWFAGDVYIGSTSGTNKDNGSKKLATEDYVNNLIGTNEELATKEYVDNLIGSILNGAS